MIRAVLTSFSGQLSLLSAGAGIAGIAGLAVTAGPAAAATTASAPPVFSYVGEAYHRSSPAVSAVLPVARPRLAPQADHSLAELSVESADHRDIVEVGWVRSRGIAGGPRLFVSYWAAGRDHVDAGFRPASAAYRPFQELRPGTSVRLGLSYAAGGWNISVQGHRIGSFPGRLWGGGFRKASAEQAFGEVESYGRSRTDMIDGRTDRAITGFRLNGAATPAGSFYSSAADGYYLGAHGATWFRLGGPGR
jgi:hypothetical protein